jgi:adenosine deaminase
MQAPALPNDDDDDDASLTALARSLPKVLLHEHLDGGLRVPTLIELARGRGITLPSDDVAELTSWFDRRAHAGSLPAYLEGFGLTIAAMASPAAMARVAFEAAEDARADGCVLAELRCAPNLWEDAGIRAEAAIEALLAGLQRSPLPTGLIVCALRHHSPAETERMARLALRYQAQGVIAFDLAGPEFGHPPSEHAGAFAAARAGGLPITCHAGEADEARRVIEAGRLGARRIGHGVRLADALQSADGRSLIDEAMARRLHLEVCVTSNLHTGAAASRASHPIRALWEAGIDLSFHTDNRLMSGVSASAEAASLVRENGFSWAELAAMSLRAAQASFLPEAAREQAQASIRRWLSAQGPNQAAEAASPSSKPSTP